MHMQMFEDLEARIEQYTEGRVQVELFYMSELVPPADQLDALDKGVIDLAFTYTGYWAGKLPDGVGMVEGGGTLFWLDIWDCYDLFWNHGMEDVLTPLYAKFGVQYIAQSWTNYCSLWSKVPIHTLADVAGVKARSVGPGALILKGLGFSVVTLPGAEIYTALMTGTVDAATYGAWGADLGMKFHEVVDYVIWFPYVWAGNEHYIASMSSWNKLSKQDQFLIKEACKANAVRSQQICNAGESQAKAEILAKKPTLTEITITDPAFLAKRAEVLGGFLDDWAAGSPEGAQAVKIVRDYLKMKGIE